MCRIAKRFPVFAEIDGKEQKDRISIGLLMTQYIVRSEIAIHTLVEFGFGGGSDNLTLHNSTTEMIFVCYLPIAYFFSAFCMLFVCFCLLLDSFLIAFCLYLRINAGHLLII